MLPLRFFFLFFFPIVGIRWFWRFPCVVSVYVALFFLFYTINRTLFIDTIAILFASVVLFYVWPLYYTAEIDSTLLKTRRKEFTGCRKRIFSVLDVVLANSVDVNQYEPNDFPAKIVFKVYQLFSSYIWFRSQQQVNCFLFIHTRCVYRKKKNSGKNREHVRKINFFKAGHKESSNGLCFPKISSFANNVGTKRPIRI